MQPTLATCCHDLILTSENTETKDILKDMLGEYHYVFEANRIDDIANGKPLYKKIKGHGYIFKSHDDSWSVSLCYRL